MNWEAVGQLLEQNVPVTKLWHFAIGEFGDTGVARLAAALAKNTMLKELDFDNGSYGDSGITAKGAARLALALETNTTLMELKIDGNKNIGDEGAAHMAVALEKNRAVTKLNLSGNGIRFEGAARLAAALEKNTTLTSLRVDLSKPGEYRAKARERELKKRIHTALNRNEQAAVCAPPSKKQKR